MTYKATYTCNVCLEDVGRECLGVRFVSNEEFKIEDGSPEVRFHMCLRCAEQMREQLNQLTERNRAAART